MQQVNAPNPAGLVIVLVLAAIAVSGSDKKWRAVLLILGWTALGFVVGTGIGFAFGSAGAAGSAAGVMSLLMGAGASIKKISDNHKAKAPS